MRTVILIIFIIPMGFFSQSNMHEFKKLSGPEKKWVVFHPFVAKKSMRISKECVSITDSVFKAKTLSGPLSGGQIDAFRHGYWMASLTSELGKKKAVKLGNAHEKGNKKDFDAGRLEEGLAPDEAAMNMDLANNLTGVCTELNNHFNSKKIRLNFIINQVKQGEYLIIKVNSKGVFVDKNGEIILNWEGKWENERVLVPSNSIFE